MNGLRLILLASLFTNYAIASEQNPDESSFDEPQFDAFDSDFDDAFDGEFDDSFEGENQEEPSLLDKIFSSTSLKLSQQLLAEVNNHQQIEHNRTQAFLKYSQYFESGIVLQASAQSSVYWPKDYNAENDEPTLDARINELFIQGNIGDNSYKIGRQNIVWGEVEGGVFDVLNPSDSSNLAATDVEDQRLNQWMLSLDRYSNNNRMTSFINFYPQFNPVPSANNPLSGGMEFPEFESNDALFEYGLKASWQLSKSNISLGTAYLWDNSLSFDNSEIVATDYWLTGVSANYAHNNMLLKADTVINLNKSFSNGIENIQKNSIDVSFGFDWTVNNDVSVVTGINASHILDYQSSITSEQTSGSLFLMASQSLLNSDLSLQGMINRAFDGSFTMVNVSQSYTYDDNWSFDSGLLATYAEQDSQFVIVNEDLRVHGTLNYAF